MEEDRSGTYFCDRPATQWRWTYGASHHYGSEWERPPLCTRRVYVLMTAANPQGLKPWKPADIPRADDKLLLFWLRSRYNGTIYNNLMAEARKRGLA